ncbi:MAG: SGNH/GDSL hydrolase family protein [Pirellulales bacterium]
MHSFVNKSPRALPPHRGLLLCLTLLYALSGAVGLCAAEPNRWESAIEQFEQSDAEHPPEKGGTLFVGSSSIRFWRLDDSFPQLHALNRGFGGSEIADSIHYFDRIVAPYEPRTIVLYAGDNDIDGGKSADEVVADFKTFAAKVHKSLPETRLLFIAVKPSIARWKLYDKMYKANAAIKAQCDTDPLLTYVDIATPMLGADGKPREELFIQDGLHLNADGYALWAKILEPLLAEGEPQP